MKILLAEDSTPLAARIARALHHEAFAVDVAHNGEDALHLGLTGAYECIVLDLGLPDLDGAAVLKRWRDAGVNFPVMVLTARHAWADKAVAFAAGADDYLTKPFLAEELVVRVRALVRRGQGVQLNMIRCGDLVCDPVSFAFTFAGEPLKLTAFEFRILFKLTQFLEKVVNRDALLESVYESDADIPFNSIEVLIGRLRRKIGQDMIETVRGRGYRLTAGKK